MGKIWDWLTAPVGTGTAVQHQVAFQSPWAPTDSLSTFALDEALKGQLAESGLLTREAALRIPGVKRSHDIICSLAAGLAYFQMDGAQRTTDQPKWLTNSLTNVSPYHRMWGVTSDQFMSGWACLGFNADHSDALHIPFGMWGVRDDGRTVGLVSGAPVPAEYTDHLVAIPLGYGSNGILNDGADAIHQAQKVADAYDNRLDNPVPLTVITIAGDRWDAMTKTQRRELRTQFVEGRIESATAMVPDYVKVDVSGTLATDLYESARNASRLDLANHGGVPASLIEATRQGGGGGQDIRYSNDTTARNELYDFGVAKYVRAFESRMSLDDVSAPGLSIRADLSAYMASPGPTINSTSED